jgi:hypothetical protein
VDEYLIVSVLVFFVLGSVRFTEKVRVARLNVVTVAWVIWTYRSAAIGRGLASDRDSDQRQRSDRSSHYESAATHGRTNPRSHRSSTLPRAADIRAALPRGTRA